MRLIIMLNMKLCLFYFAILIYATHSFSIEKTGITELPEIVGDQFLYFGFGSNLLMKRIRINNKSAVRWGMGKLKDYELDFYTNSTRWQGAPATIVDKPGKYVWGAIWKIDVAQMSDLDRQESVPEGIYIPLSVPIETPSGEVLTCRAYKLKKTPPVVNDNEPKPYDRQPSATYLKTIIKGANETGLPSSYIEFLRTFKHNGVTVDTIEDEFDLKDVVI